MITLAVCVAVGAGLGWFARGWTVAPVVLPLAEAEYVEPVSEARVTQPMIYLAPPSAMPVAVDATYAIVSDAGDVRFPQEGEDGTNGGAAKRAWEAVTANPDGQLWTFYHDGAVRGRTGVVS